MALTGAFAFGHTVPPLYVNLRDFPLYLKSGFDLSNTAAPDLEDGSWLVKTRWSHVIISSLKEELPALPGKRSLTPTG